MIDPILITGAARSGTSLTAGIVDKAGAWGGQTAGPTKYNQRGMFENNTIRNAIVKPYLRRINCDPLGQFPLPRLDQIEPYPQLRQNVLEVLRMQKYDRKKRWYYKGAKMCLLWPIWKEAFPDAQWIIVRRDARSIANSCCKTGFMRAYEDEEGWRSWVNVHTKRFDEMKDAGMNIREVWPSKFIAGNYDEIRSVVEWLGLTWDDDRILSFIEPALWSK